VVHGQVVIRAVHTNGVTDYAWVYVGTRATDCLSDAPPSGCAGKITLRAELPSMWEGFHTVPISRIIPVSGSGTHTFYVNGHGTTTTGFFFAWLIPVFIPSW
jgi:hypothetical protein